MTPKEFYTRDELLIKSLPELQEIARGLGLPALPEGRKRGAWIDEILKIAERKSTTAARAVRIDNYQPLKTLKKSHTPLYKICGGCR